MKFIPKHGSLLLEGRHQQIYFDVLLLAVVVSIMSIGYIMVTSASLHLGERLSEDSLYYPRRQLIHIGLGVLIAGIIIRTPIELWQKIAPGLFFFGLFLLVLVLVPGFGVKVNGSTRWLSIAGVRVQASELFKLIAVIYMADYISRNLSKVRASVFTMIAQQGWNSVTVWIFSPFGLLALACFLLLQEPDFGSTVVVALIAMGMLLLAGARMGIFIAMAIILALVGGFLVYGEAYRFRRLAAFMDPWADPLESGYQLTQALIAFGRGEVLGVGLGGSVQKLYYLPEAHTDFLFSVLGEEMGLVGVIVVIGLFTLLTWRAFTIGYAANRENKIFAAFLAYGFAIWFGFQAFVNMGVNMGMLPTKGLTLPLMSYGGGSIVVMCIAIALLFRIHSETINLRLNPLNRRPKWR